MAIPLKFGDEFLVNTTTQDWQLLPSITGLADGRFVVSWSDGSETAEALPNSSIRAQVFNANGTASGSEILVSSTDTFPKYPIFNPSSVAALEDGRFVVTWSSNNSNLGDTSDRSVQSQIFNGDGTASGDAFLVNTSTANDQLRPIVTTLSDDRFVISWEDYSQSAGDTSGAAVRAQIYDSDGNKAGSEFLVNTITADGQHGPTIAALGDGRFVVAWQDKNMGVDSNNNWAIRAQIFDSDGSKSAGEFQVNTTTGSRRYEPEITALADDRFVISWTDSRLSSENFFPVVRAQIFNGDGSPFGGEFVVNSPTDGPQFRSSITALEDGRFVVSWTDYDSPGDIDDFSIRAQVFNLDGSKAGGEFQVNTPNIYDQDYSSIAALADGRFVISWMDRSETGDDTSDWAIRAQIFDPREAAVTLAGTGLNDDFVGTSFDDLISGSFGDDRLDGRKGDDDLRGGAGSDTLFGRTGIDRLSGGDGDDRLIGGKGDDVLIGGAGVDFMAGGAGDDRFTVDQAADKVVEKAGEGRDTVRSAAISLDMANYSNVERLKLVGALDLSLTGDGLGNVLAGNDGNNLVNGLGGDDILSGKDGNDILSGGAGDDLLRGGEGADTLTGGLGRDRLTGGEGTDRFVFNDIADSGATSDVIRDFNQGDGDLIDLSGIDTSIASGDQAFDFVGAAAFSSVQGELRFLQTASNTIVQGDVDGDGVADFELVLNGLVTLTAGDFVL